MSVNITVNGKYTKGCLRHNLLHDPERIRKESEDERRKMRIQQVRAVSKNMAKKVRENVEMEKQRQLKKIEEIKAQEMEMWRQNILAQQQKDFRSAIFQVGTAHRAAKAENAKQAKKKVQERPRKPLERSKNPKPTVKVGKENILKNVDVQTDITGKCYPKPPLGYRNVFNSSSSQLERIPEVCSSELEEECENEDSISVSTELFSEVSQTSTSSLSESVEIMKTVYPRSSKSIAKLSKSAPVVVEVHPESDASVINTSNIEDQRKESNRSVSRVVSKKTPKKTTKTDKLEEFKSTSEEPSTSAAGKKRFTQISDIIRQQKSSDEMEKQPRSISLPPGSFRMRISPTKSKSKSPIRTPKQSENLLTGTSPTKSKSKSPTTSRPTSTHTAGTSKSNSIPSQRSATGTRVQFYDYNNKFQKEYEQPASVVEAHEPTGRTEMNAMEQAQLAEKLREAREAEMEKLRQKSDERCQKAIEREQVRRACEDLTAKLDALTKQRQVLPSDTHQFSSARLAKAAEEKETKLNNAVEQILRRSAVITCPVINRNEPEPTASSSGAPKPNAYNLNLGSAFNGGENSLNSSDSCCSILLGYVNGQSKQIADDIKKYNEQNGETDKEKCEKLQNLLMRINRLRESLIKELQKCSTSAEADKERVETMMNSISEFRKERENILINGDSKDSISRRESDLKKKEEILEKRVREFYEMQKAAKKKDKMTNTEEDRSKKRQQLESEQEDSEEVHSRSKMPQKTGSGEKEHKDVAVQKEAVRFTEVQRQTENKGNIKSKKGKPKSEKPKKDDEITREQESQEDFTIYDEESEDEFVERRKLLVGEKPVEIVIKVKGDSPYKKTKKLPSKSPRKLSTLIQSPTPKKSRRKFTTVRSSESSSTSYRSLPPTIHNDVDKLLETVPRSKKQGTTEKIPLQPQSHEEKDKPTKKGSTLNPLMAHYVQRLLGMSRTSINALGVNSSDITTPSSSIINTTANLSAAETEQLASSRLEHVQKFIEDNYSFVGELEESLRPSNSTDNSLKAVEAIWKQALKEQKSKKDAVQKAQTSIEKPIKPALKKTAKKQGTHFVEKEPQTQVQVDKSTQLTDHCTRRIAKLTAMINKVRQEKQKILETTLSSVSENGRNSTEYLELPDRRNNSEEATSRILDSQLVKSAEHLSAQSPEATTQLEKNKLTGMSRDSGISLSRPITVQESRESPTEDLPQIQSSTESLSAQFKKPKPPISIARYSPQLVEDIPHELSTIFEVDTPGTSKINASVHANNGQELAVPQLQDERVEKIAYRKFPTFEEYARLNRLDMSQFDPEFSMQFEKEFNEFMNLAREGKVIDYEEFTSFSKYFPKSSSGDDREAAEELLASLKLANLSFKKFPTRKEYLNNIGVSTSDLLDSKSLENVEESRNLDSNSSSCESLMNVEKELQLRKILTKSFKQNARPVERRASTSTSASLPSDSPRNDLENNQHQGEISGIKQLTGGGTSEEQSDNLENDLKRMGIKWPSVMKKKVIETQALSSSTSSSLGAPVYTPRKKPSKKCQTVETSYHKETYETTIQTEEGGRQLNLREFLTKELLKRTTTSSSFSYSDDSVASSILRSIIGSMTPSPQQHGNGAVPGLERHKTSTPMASHSTSSGRVASKSQGGASSIQLFSGESRLSSVHFNNSSREVNQIVEKDVDAESNKKF